LFSIAAAEVGAAFATPHLSGTLRRPWLSCRCRYWGWRRKGHPAGQRDCSGSAAIRNSSRRRRPRACRRGCVVYRSKPRRFAERRLSRRVVMVIHRRCAAGGLLFS
jgi:hypothetical protein